MRGIWPLRLITPHVDLGVPIARGLRILEATGAPIEEEREEGALSYRVDLPEFGMAIHETDGNASAVWYDDPAGRLTPFGRRRKLRLYLARYASTGSWRRHTEGGGIAHFYNDADGLHLAYGAHQDVIRINGESPNASDDTLEDLEEHQRIVDAIRTHGVQAIRREVERRGGVDVPLPLDVRLIEVVAGLGDVEGLAYLLDANASSAGALSVALSNGQLRAFEYLLERLTPDIDAVDENGNTLLICAASAGHIDIVRLLLQHGADPDARDPLGRKAAGVALSDEIARLLSPARRG